MTEVSYLPPKITLKKLPKTLRSFHQIWITNACGHRKRKKKSKMEAMHFPVSLKEAEE